MGEQRAWLRSRRKKRLRFTAVMLACCLLLTNYPDIVTTFSSYAQAAEDGAAAGKNTEGIGSTGGEAPDGDGAQAPGNGGHGNSDGGNDAGGTGTSESPDDGDGAETPGGGDDAGTPETPEGGDGAGTPETPEGGDGTGTPETPDGGDGTGTPETPDGGDGTETPETPGGGDGTGTPETPEGGDGAGTPETPEGGDGMETPETPEGGDGMETPETRDGEDDADDTPGPEEETDAVLADIDIESLPDTEEAWDAYLESLDEETRAIVEPMEVFNVRTFEAVVPAEAQYAGTDGFAKQHKMRVVWVNDPEHAIGKTALSSSCAKSYICVRLPDKGGSQVRKCYFNKDILTDKSGKESVLAEFTLPLTYEEGDPFPTDVGACSKISLLVGRPSGEVQLQLYDYMEQTYETYYSADFRSGSAVLGGILSKEEWLSELGDTVGRPQVSLGYKIYEQDAALRLRADGYVMRRFGVSMADNYGVALPLAEGGWSAVWSLRSGDGVNGGNFPGSRYHVSVVDSDLTGLALEAGQEAGAAELDGVSLYARAVVRYRNGIDRGFSFPIRIDSDAVRCKVQYAGTDGSYIRTDAKNHNSAYTIKDLRDFPEVDDSWKALFDGTYTGTDGKNYRAGDTYTGNVSLGLFPNWKGSYVTLTLDGTVDQNGQTSAGLAANGKQTVRVAVGERYEENTPVPEKAPAGYEFAGYYTEKAGQGKRYFDGTGKAVRACDMLEDTTLYAGWRPSSRRIIYRLDACLPDSLPSGFGGLAWTEFEISDCLRGDTLAKKGLRLPEEDKGEVWRRGWRLEGWYTEKTGGDRVTNTTALPVEEDSYTFYAHWEPEECTMTYDANGGVFNSGTKTVKVRYGEPYGTTVTTAAPVPVRDGYQFMGYGVYKGAFTPLREDDVVYSAQSFTVYAVWVTEVTVNLDTDGGTLAAGQLPYIKGKTGQRINVPNPSRTGYTFIRWKDEKGGTSELGMNNSHSYKIPGDAGATVTLKASWVENTYTVRFQKNAVSGVSGDMGAQTFTCGRSAALTACAYTREGYTFAGWNTKADGSGTSYADRAAVRDLSTVAGGSVDLYAKWEPERYTVSFDANGGTLAAGKEKKTVAFGSPYGELPVPGRADYTFLGWYTEKTGGDRVTEDAVMERAEGHTLYAHWNYDYFTLSFDLRGGSGTAQESFLPRKMKKTGQSLPSAAPVLAGLDFGGWSRTAGGAADYQKGGQISWQSDGAAQPGKETMILYAVWTTNKPHVAYNPNCSDPTLGNMPQLQMLTNAELEKGEVKISSQKPTRTGYTFKGWARTATDGTSLYQPGESVQFAKTTGSLTLYAVWEENTNKTVSLTLMDGDKQLSKVFYPAGTQVTLPGFGQTERVNGNKTEAFKGWSKSADASAGEYQADSSLTLDRDTTLYAIWKTIPGWQCKWRASETDAWKYAQLETADGQLLNGGEIVMLMNVSKYGRDPIELVGSYTLDLNGKTLSHIKVTDGSKTICNGTLSDQDCSGGSVGLALKGNAYVTLRDVKLMKVENSNRMVDVQGNSRLTITGNTYMDTSEPIENNRIWVGANAHLTVEYLELHGSIIFVGEEGAGCAVEIKDGFFYTSYPHNDNVLAGWNPNSVINQYRGNLRTCDIKGGCFANEKGLTDNGKIWMETTNDKKPIIHHAGERDGEVAVGASPRYGNINKIYNGPWYRIKGQGSQPMDIWEINGNRSTKKAPDNSDMKSGPNTFRLISASVKSDGAVSWTKSGSRADVDLNGYTYVANGGFTMTGGMEGNNSTIGNGVLKAVGTASFQKAHIASDMAVKADVITLDAGDTIEAGARFYANSEIVQLAFGDIVLVKQAESNDGDYAHYYIAMPWETSGTAPKESVTFHSNYPADSAGTAGTAAKEQTRGAKWSLPSQFDKPTGFTFYEWNTEADGSGSRITAEVVFDSAVKDVYAVWKRDNVTVTFDLNGGGRTPAPVWMEGAKETGTRLIPYNYPVGNPPAAKRAGYTLEGWYDTSAATGGTKLDEKTKATGAKTYYARWKEASGTAYTVKYQTEGGTLLGQKEFYGTTGTAIDLTSPADIRQSFTGYTYQKKTGDSTIKADGSSVVTLTYALKRNAVKVTVKENTGSAETDLSGIPVTITGGGSGSGNLSTSGNVTTKSNCAYGSTVTLTAGVKSGYEFVEWKGDQTGANPDVSFTMPDLPAGEAVEITAVYRKKSYPAAYDLKNIEVTAAGGGAAPGKVAHGSDLSVKLTAQTGYELPEAGAVSVTVGGARRDLRTAGSTGDTYVKNSDGTAVLTVRNVTGDLVIAAAGVPKDYSVRFQENKASGQTDARIEARLSTGGDLPAQTPYGTSCTVLLLTAAGYALPDAIAVYTAVDADGSGGTALTAGTDYHYDAANGTVFLTKVTGHIRIEAGAVPGRDTLYRAAYYLMEEDGGYEEGSPYETAYLTGQTGTQIDVDALAGRKNYDGYTYDTFAWETGAGTPVIAADGSTVVKLYYKRNQYTVTVKTKAPDGSDAWTDWTGMEAAGAENPYYYRGRVDIDLGGLPERKGYDRDGWTAFDSDGWAAYENWLENGGAGDEPAARYRGKNARIAIRMPDSDLVVIPVYTPQRLRVSDEELTHVAFVAEPQAWYEQPFAAQMEADSGYNLPDTITIAIGEGAEKAVLEDGDFTYDKDTGVVEITAKEKVTGTITIHAEGVRQERTQTVFLRYADGVTEEMSHLRPSRETGAYTVTYNGRFVIALTPENGYVLPETLTLMVGVDDDGNGGDSFTADTDSGSTQSGTRISYDRETGMLSALTIRDDILILIPEAPESSGEPVSYTVEHYRADEDGGYELAAVSYREALAGTAITEEMRRQEQKNYAGYTYVKYEWQTGSGAGGAGSPLVAADGSTVLKLYYDIAVYELTVVMEEGLHGGISGQNPTAATQTGRYHYGDSIELELSEVAAGRSYKGWHIDGEPVNTGWHYAFAMPARDMTVVAKSGAGNYELMAYGSHGKAKIPEEEEEGYLSQIAYETEKSVTILPDAHYNLPEQIKILVDDGERKISMGSAGSRNAKDGDTYVSASDGKGGEITLTVRGDTAVEFEMVPETYQLTFDPAGGTLEQTTRSLTYGEPYGELPVPERKGYDFLGWYSAAAGGTKVEAETALLETGDHTLYAQWKKQPVKNPDGKEEEPDGGTAPVPGKEPGGGTGSVPEKEPGGGTESAPVENTEKAGKAVLDGDEFVALSTEDEAVRESTEAGRENAYDLGAGKITVEVNCIQDYLTASVTDTSAVVNSVLSAEQKQMAQSGQSIRIRIDVSDISDQVPSQDKEAVETGIEAYRETYPQLTPGMYMDISLSIKIGDGDWESISTVKEPIEVVIGIPENLRREGRTFYIIRVHEGEYAFMEDRDETADTVTISTDRFSTYAILYEGAEESGTAKPEEKAKCGLCHICPTFLGICYFIWLALILAVTAVVIFVAKRRKKEEEKEGQSG